MNLHEYQAKRLFSDYSIPIPQGIPVRSEREVSQALQTLGHAPWVCKAQVHAGGRGKAGGVKLAHSVKEVQDFLNRMLGSRLVTHQSGPPGLPINEILIEEGLSIDRELYLGALIDRGRSRLIFMASSAGGMDIEQVAAEQPEQILRAVVNPVLGLRGYQCRRLGFGLGLSGKQVGTFHNIMMALYHLFVDKDLSLIEINPLVLTKGGELLALDGKITVDGNALFRHPALTEMRDISQEDPTEYAASQHGLNYITLGGNIACMVNGAGLAMATMDLIKLHGGEPANFLDVGGGTTADKVAEAFKLILAGQRVKAILVNIFGGIVRCDLIAKGIINAVQEVGVSVPIVVRLEGTNVKRGREMLAASGLAITAAEDLNAAARVVVNSVSKTKN